MIDFCVIGGGIVGASTAMQLKHRWPQAEVVLLEKETTLAHHQSGRNSGVIHAGVYYEPGSLKARFCKAGLEATVAFCRTHGIPVDQCGKLIVATNVTEHAGLQALYRRAQSHDLDATLLDGAGLRAAEPNVRGVAAIYVSSSGIVDFGQVTRQMGAVFTEAGGELRCNAEVTAIDERASSVTVGLADGSSIDARYVVACGGLMADRLAGLQQLDRDFRIVPYRGEYYRLRATKNEVVRHLIYPVPDPALPFLGIHLTPMIDGTVTVGPSALQGFKREGYGRFNFSLRDCRDMLTYPGYWRVSLRYWRTGCRELLLALSKRRFLAEVQKYCPSIALEDLVPHPAGVRAMAVSRDGRLLHDFLFAETPRCLHVCNAPSPAATAAIPIGAHLCDMIERRMSP